MTGYWQFSSIPSAKVHHCEHSDGPIKFDGHYWILLRSLPLNPTKMAIISGAIYEFVKRKRALNILANI